MDRSNMQKNKRREQKIVSIYSRSLITRDILLPITSVGKNIRDTIQQVISLKILYREKQETPRYG